MFLKNPISAVFFSVQLIIGLMSIEVKARVSLYVSPDDTIFAGDTAKVIGRIYDDNGIWLPALSDSIRWKLDSSTSRPGDEILIPQGDTTEFTGIVPLRKVGIIGTYGESLSPDFLNDTCCIYIRPLGFPPEMDITLSSVTPVPNLQVQSHISLVEMQPRLTVYLDSVVPQSYLYAVRRDHHGNFINLADNAVWESLNPDSVTASASVNKTFECVVAIASGVREGTAKIAAFLPGYGSDTALVIIRPANNGIMPASIVLSNNYWRVFSDNGAVRISFPTHGMHRVKAYSLAGYSVYSRITRENELWFMLPRGVYILTVETIGCGHQSHKKIIVQ